MTGRSFDEVLASVAADWIRRPGVHGVGEGMHDDVRCIVVLADPSVAGTFPDDVDGQPVVVRESGEFHASPAEPGTDDAR